MPRLTPEQARLVEQNADLPEIAVKSFFRSSGFTSGNWSGVEYEEVVSACTEKMCQLATKFNGHGSFRGYVGARLGWFIVDFLRQNGPRHRTRKDGTARERPRLQAWTEYDNNDAIDRGHETSTESKMREEDRDPGFEQEIVGWEFFKVAVEKLTERERSIIWMRYVEGMTLAQIGEVLGVTESRISQIEGKALRRLRKDPDVIRTAAEATG